MNMIEELEVMRFTDLRAFKRRVSNATSIDIEYINGLNFNTYFDFYLTVGLNKEHLDKEYVSFEQSISALEAGVIKKARDQDQCVFQESMAAGLPVLFNLLEFIFEQQEYLAIKRVSP